MWLESSLPEEAPDIDVILFGRNGKSLPQNVMSLENEPFLLHARGIGEITKASFVLLDSHLKRGLKLQNLRLKDLDTKEELGFQTAERWLFGEDGSETVTELAAIRPGRAPLNEVLYSVSVYTGTLPASETDADVFLTIFGENGDSCKRQLKSGSSPTVFEKGKVSIGSLVYYVPLSCDSMSSHVRRSLILIIC
ncbi:lipoxygenase homology domain-containing protein 1-like [Lissotriton helveticus]